ncbi:HupE/UreJ family protein [Rubrivivax gelatinosus]|uniref:HupE/UreJ protein n=1 Tax=Rubrivivax gelatinosus (strain NBRC 100245 / IL144) TaxID=983917 RepID=I0HRF5_RUBGI|nr:HupE/UreJ family protein [Rubrivivax gelatinosus]BAL95592.1 hypothetical protein RGE_22510 [Rubrivivax gelatinosus IL144]
MRRVLRGLLLAWLALVAGAAAAHEMSIAEMELRETAPGEFLWQWTATARPVGTDLVPRWPAPCTADGNLLRCGDAGLKGRLAVDGVGKRYSAVIVKMFWRDGGSRVATLTAAQPEVQLFGSAEDRRGFAEIARAYVGLGVQHILTGTDHLMFVAGLLFLVGFNRRLVWTVTAFTVAHSLTLALSALGWLSLRPPPVEATIALSIVLVAAEALRREDTLSRRWPALVAFGFGLVHGLGFAGALRQFGLPENHLLTALVGFNVGVEIGQLLVIAAAWAVCRALAPWPGFARTRGPALYAMGSVAAWWACARIVKIVAA